MDQGQRPHYVWIGAIGLAALGLGVLAWSLWTGSDDDEPDGPVLDPDRGAAEETAARRAELLARADGLMAEARFEAANEALTAAEEFGWSNELEAARARLSFREASYRAEPRAIELRVASIETSDEVEELFARVSVNGSVVFETESFAPPSSGSLPARECLVTVRSSFDEGATLELLAPGGLIGGPDLLLGPSPVAPLAQLRGGRLEILDPDAVLPRVTISYRKSPHDPGLWPDEPPAHVPADATAAQVVAAAQSALEGDHIEHARRLLRRLQNEAPGHPDLAFTTQRIESRAEYLHQNRTRVHLTVLEAAADPKTSGKLWASGGSAPSFKAAIVSGKRTLAKSSGSDTAPFLVPGSELDPPKGNMLEFMERGDLPLTFVLFDTSPTFGSTEVGSVELGVTLADLPQGSGTLTVERESSVLVLPESESNRLRRVVLRWFVER